MRITTNLLFNTTLAHIQQHNARLLQTSEEASSGLRLQRPSDDPAGTRRVLDLRHTLASLDQFKSLLDGTDTALQDTGTLLLSAKGLALRAASDTVSAEQRSDIAHEVGGLFAQAISLGNSVVHGRYLFAGQVNRFYR